MNINLRLFGPLRDIVGKDELILDVPHPYTGESAFAALSSMFPGVRPWQSSVRVAVNLEYKGFDHTLHLGDEVSFIPPVSGG